MIASKVVLFSAQLACLLCIAARAYKGRPSLLRTVGNLQVTPVLTQDGRYLPEFTIFKKDCRAHPSIYSPAVFTKDGRR